MQSRRAYAVMAAVLVALLVTSGCGSDEETEQPPPGTDQLKPFVTALAERPARFDDARELTAEGSPARRYVAFQEHLDQVRRQDGVQVGRTRVVKAGTGFDLCGPQPGRQRCSRFSAPVLGRDETVEELASFEVDGDEISDNVSVGRGEPQGVEGNGGVEFLSSYRQPSTGHYWVLLSVTAGDEPIDLRLDEARYTRVGAESQEPRWVSAAERVEPGGMATVALVFPADEGGGGVRLDLRVGGRAVPVNVATAPYVPST